MSRETPLTGFHAQTEAKRQHPVRWVVSNEPVNYASAVAVMEREVQAIAAGLAPECVWLLEHPALYTAGTSANDDDISAAPPFPVHRTGRGGQFTYHGPGQRVAYVMLDIKARGGDVRAFVEALEGWLIDTLDTLGVGGVIREGRVGVWVPRRDDPLSRDDKIAALGIRLRKWVSFHGVSLNVDPDLTHFDAIVPCGIRDHGVTSLRALGAPAELSACDAALKQTFETRFGPTGPAEHDDVLRVPRPAETSA